MDPVARAAELLGRRRVVALTGAGISTDSGIPDYRGPGAVLRTPMTYAEFCSGEVAQRRYWSRAFIGWQHMSAAEPNAGHRRLVELQRSGELAGLITQNVDGLHARAGHAGVVDLHGRIAEVVCLDCRGVSPRAALQHRLEVLNPRAARADTSGVTVAPDGDAAVCATEPFTLAGCEFCGGRLKPHVVFFGENVPRERIAMATAMVDAADALLVVGSSLSVLSGLRFARQAARAGKAVVIVNRGPTRGDELADVRISDGCSETLAGLAEALVDERVVGSHRCQLGA